MTLDQLLDEREIAHQLFALAEAMDRRDWGALDEILLENATGDFGSGTVPSSRAAFVAMFRHFLGKCGPTQHLLGNLVVELRGDEAKTRCYVRDIHQGAGERAHLTFASPGRYDDRWRRTADGWRLAHRTKTNLMFIGSVAALGLDPAD